MSNSNEADANEEKGNINGDLDAISRLERSEAFDENLEGIHATLSRRDSIRQSLTSIRSNSVTGRRRSSHSIEGGKKDDDNKTHYRKRSSKRLSADIEKVKQSQRRRDDDRRSLPSELSSRNLQSFENDNGSPNTLDKYSNLFG